MNIYHFATPRKVRWEGEHEGSANVQFLAFCEDASVSQEMLSVVNSIGASAEVVALSFNAPTFVIFDTGATTHADLVTLLVFTEHAQHADSLSSLFRELHAKHYLDADGAHHWMRHATKEEIEIHHRVNDGLPHLHPDELAHQVALHRGAREGEKAELPHSIEHEQELHLRNEGKPWVPHALRTKVPDAIQAKRSKVEARLLAHNSKGGS